MKPYLIPKRCITNQELYEFLGKALENGIIKPNGYVKIGNQYVPGILGSNDKEIFRGKIRKVPLIVPKDILL